MTAVFVSVIGLCVLVTAELLPSLFGELSYTLLMGLSFVALWRLGRKGAGLQWQRGLYALAAAALISALANLAWVYGSLAGELPVALEFIGATLWTLECAPWAYALSLAIFVAYRQLRGAVVMELVAQLILLVSSVTFIIAVVLGFVLDFRIGITIADNAKTYFSALLVVPAVALWFSGTGFSGIRFSRTGFSGTGFSGAGPSGSESRLSRPFLLLSFATIAWFVADLLYVRLPDTYNLDMIYNVFSTLQWWLVYLAGARYLKSGLVEAKVQMSLIQTLPNQTVPN
ncbi:hypothetical protein BH24DEI2_BH24DEI2_25810 [soil metagenome]